MIARLVIACIAAAALAACASANNSEVQTAQERSACAEMGLDPGSQAFGQCVGNLDATVFQYMSSAYH